MPSIALGQDKKQTGFFDPNFLQDFDHILGQGTNQMIQKITCMMEKG